MSWLGLGNIIANPGQAYGTNNIIGNAINDITGVNQSAKNQFNNQMALQKDAQNFAKWQMSNAHQMEIQDLQKAGLNPVLSAGGNGASAGVSMGTASAGVSGGDPISMAGQIIGMMNNSKQTNGIVKNLEADSKMKNAEALRTLATTNPEVNKLIKEYDLLIQNIQESKSREELNKASQKFEEWKGRHPILAETLGGVSGMAGTVTAAALHVGAIKNATKVNSAKKTTRKTNYNSKGKMTGFTDTVSY